MSVKLDETHYRPPPVAPAVPAREAPQTTIRRPPPQLELLKLDAKLSQRLEALLRSGQFGVRNTGPALQSGRTDRGCRPYDSRVLTEVRRLHAATRAALEQLVAAVSRGDPFQGALLCELIAEFAPLLQADCDAVLSVAVGAEEGPSFVRHGVNVALVSMGIGLDLGCDARHTQTLGLAGLVQELGMLRVSPEIRSADRRLSSVERLNVQCHPLHTAAMLERVSGLPNLVPLVAWQVHENLDGSGYPRGRKACEIHLFARVIQVADAWLAMTSRRPYRPPVMPYAAMECLLRDAESLRVAPEAVRSLLHIVSLFPLGSYVELSDGRTTQVHRANADDFTRPIVAVTAGSTQVDGTEEPPATVELIDLRTSTTQVVQALPAPGSGEVPLSSEIANWRVRAARFLDEPGAPAHASTDGVAQMS